MEDGINVKRIANGEVLLEVTTNGQSLSTTIPNGEVGLLAAILMLKTEESFKAAKARGESVPLARAGNAIPIRPERFALSPPDSSTPYRTLLFEFGNSALAIEVPSVSLMGLLTMSAEGRRQ